MKKKKKLTIYDFLGNDPNDKYLNFIKECLNKPVDVTMEVHEHHIVSKHWFNSTNKYKKFCCSKENLIFLSLADHIKAHQILYEMYNKPADKAAVLMLQGDKEESRRIWRKLGAEAVHKKLKEEGRLFWDSNFQSEMAKRSMEKSDALITRSIGGKVGGRVRNLNRVITSNERYEFSFNNKPVLCILNCQTGGDVLKELQAYKATRLKRVTLLLKGKRQNLNGWSCKKLN